MNATAISYCEMRGGRGLFFARATLPTLKANSCKALGRVRALGLGRVADLGQLRRIPCWPGFREGQGGLYPRELLEEGKYGKGEGSREAAVHKVHANTLPPLPMGCKPLTAIVSAWEGAFLTFPWGSHLVSNEMPRSGK